MTLQLHQEVLRFKQWAAVCGKRYGEWECDYGLWDELLPAAKIAMGTYDSQLPNEECTNELLYAIARDNETEQLREELIKYPSLLRHLARCAVASTDPDAKWQLAQSVADARLHDAADLIGPYLADADEYVRRRSLLAIAPFAPGEAENIAKAWIDEEYEYSRLAGIIVLDRVDSESIEYYLKRHANDPSEHVRFNVKEIRDRRRDRSHAPQSHSTQDEL